MTLIFDIILALTLTVFALYMFDAFLSHKNDE